MQMNVVIVSLTAAWTGEGGPERREVRRKERQEAKAEDGVGERTWETPSKKDGIIKMNYL